jgi:hypothetical protein
MTEWLGLVAMAIYLHSIYWLRRNHRIAAVQVDFLRRIGARDSDSIVAFWAFGASVAAIAVFFLPFSAADPRSLYSNFIDMLSGRDVSPLPSTPSPVRQFPLDGLWLVLTGAGTYLFLVWSYRDHFRWAAAQTALFRRLSRRSTDTFLVFLAFVLVAVGLITFILRNIIHF